MSLLPADFADLEPYADWALPTEAERWERRMASSMDELQAFYDAGFPRVDAALTHCDQFDLHELPDDAERLLRLVHALSLVSFAVEVWAQPEPVNVGNAEIERIREPQP